jgi:hypothetical protein
MSSFNNAAMAHFNWLEDISTKGLYGNPPGEARLTLPVTRGARLFLNAGIGAVANAGRSQKPARLDPLQPGEAGTALALALLLVIPVAVLAQSSGGVIRGTITDPSGAVVQNAVVNIVQAGTGETRRLQSNSTGLYDAPNLPISESPIFDHTAAPLQ